MGIVTSQKVTFGYDDVAGNVWQVRSWSREAIEERKKTGLYQKRMLQACFKVTPMIILQRSTLTLTLTLSESESLWSELVTFAFDTVLLSFFDGHPTSEEKMPHIASNIIAAKGHFLKHHN